MEFSEKIQEYLPNASASALTFLASWAKAREGRLVPYKESFDPLSVREMLSFVWMYEYRPDIGDFVCRLAGENVNLAWGKSIKGLTLQQIVGETDHPIVLSRWLEMVKEPHIHYGSEAERLSEQNTWQAERIIAPMETRADGIPYALGLSLYQSTVVDPDHEPLILEDTIRIPCREI